MYLLYEHHKSPDGEILVTDMLMTSFFPGAPAINFKNAQENALFEYTKKIFKDTHIKLRSYDPVSKVWSFFPPAGAAIYASLKNSAFSTHGMLSFEPIQDLSGQKLAGFIKRPSMRTIDPKDFFYTPEAPQSTSLSKEDLVKRLAPILQLTEPELNLMFTLPMLKKPYRQAALRLHPDRNNGDGSKMTELNWLWQQFQPYIQTE